jgi:phosphoenolpyruvate carboxykinase (GTP)
VGVVRRDPFAMLPFCGYDMGSYLAHWLSMSGRLSSAPPIFMVNWFRRGKDGSFLWPGYSDNMRVLKWIIDRVQGKVDAEKSPLGWVPRISHLELAGLAASPSALESAMLIDREEWLAELSGIEEFFGSLGPTFPAQLKRYRQDVAERVARG